MTNQEALDIVVKHLRKQGKKSTDGDPRFPKCMYRNPEGLKCAVGALIPDEKYKPEFEEQNVLGIQTLVPELQSLDFNFLNTLRMIHDIREVEVWEARLQKIAKSYGLNFPAKD